MEQLHPRDVLRYCMHQHRRNLPSWLHPNQSESQLVYRFLPTHWFLNGEQVRARLSSLLGASRVKIPWTLNALRMYSTLSSLATTPAQKPSKIESRSSRTFSKKTQKRTNL